MMLPIYDFAYLFNVFQMMAKSEETLQSILSSVKTKLIWLEEEEPSINYFDQRAYLTFIKAVCLRQLASYDLAVEALQDVLVLEEKLVYNFHIPPQACYEIGHINRIGKNFSDSKKWLKRARKYSNYSTELLINYRINLSLEDIAMAERESFLLHGSIRMSV